MTVEKDLRPLPPVAPVHKQVVVEVPAPRAFETFTARMGTWWHPDHRLGDEPFAEIVIEPWVAGRWYEVDARGRERQWGRVLVWSPPVRVVLAWQLDADWNYDPALETELEIRFSSRSPTSTLVELEHRHLERLGRRSLDVRASLSGPDGWSGLLERFARTR